MWWVTNYDLYRKLTKMEADIAKLTERLASMDAKTDRVAVIVTELRDKLKQIVDNAADLAAAKVAINSAVESLDRDLAQLDSLEEPPVEPA